MNHMQTSPVDDAGATPPAAVPVTAHGAPSPVASGGAGEVREASMLLRDLLELTAQFELKVGAALSVNRRDFEAMQHLIAYGPLSPSDIARRLGVTTAAATTIVDRLTAVGHVTRTPHPTDRRAVVVVPTPASVAAAMSQIYPLITGVDGLLDGFSDAEQSAITEYLRRATGVYKDRLSQ
jgi:DNA-binding MarR family transcriptional regulator